MACGSVFRFTRRVSVMVFTALLLLPTLGFAQSPWERAASILERTFNRATCAATCARGDRPSVD